MRYKFYTLFVSMVWGGQICCSQSIVINELMQSNVDYLMVENDFPDSWVELYNTTDNDFNLQGCCIGLNNEISSAYKIPVDTVIPTKGHILIFCDKEDNLLHTNFRLDSGKGDLYFFDVNGSVLDKIHLKKMPAPNVAYGRISDGSAEWQYEIIPTAGQKNERNGSDKLLPDPIFSKTGGVFSGPIEVTISMPMGDYPVDTKIYVTTDGREPDKTSLSDISFTFDINKSTVIRAKLISDSALTNRSVTQSYIYHYQETGLPIISIVSNDDYFYDSSIGILQGGDNDHTQNCYQEWRRPINAEMYAHDSNGDSHQQVFNQLCETMVGGNYSRAFPQKSLKLYAHKRWGTKRFTGDFWEDKPDVTKVKSFMLRNGGTACLYGKINDALIQKVFGTRLSDLDWQASQPALLYINGVYKGIFNMRERSDEDYVESNYNGLEDIELHNGNSTKCVYYSSKERENTLFEHFYERYTDPDCSYNELSELMDIDNFLATFITEMFSTNYDWPHNNISVWRELNENGKWRWILKDIDYAGLKQPVTFNMFNYLFEPRDSECEEVKARISLTYYGIVLYEKMMSYPQFREAFIDKFTAYLGDFLKPSITIPLIHQMNDEIESEIEQTYNAYIDNDKWYGVWGNMYSFDNITDPVEHYQLSIEEIIKYWTERPAILYQHISDYFHLGTIHPLQVSNDGLTEINGISLKEGDFEGYYYSDRPLRLNSGNADKGWLLKFEHSNGTLETYTIDNPIVELKISDYMLSTEDSINIECQPHEITSGISVVDNESVDRVYYNLTGVRILNPQNGINIAKRGNSLIKWIKK